MQTITDRLVRWTALQVFLVALLGTFVLIRESLMLWPNADVLIGGYNIHHLYTGVVILTVSAIPLVVGTPRGIMRQLLVGGFGVGLALALDEVVYLVATDGTNSSYLTPVSWTGSVLLVGGAAIHAVISSRR